MDVHQLRTFIAVARECSITRASQKLHLSQPAVSSHIKAIEETLGLELFERTCRGMRLTGNGRLLMLKAEQTLEAHRAFIEEAARIKGRPSGRLRLGSESDTGGMVLGHLLRGLSRQYPDVEVVLEHGTSNEILDGIRNRSLDAGFYNNCGGADADLATVEISRSDIYLAAPAGAVSFTGKVDWQAISKMTWICPTAYNCCKIAAEEIFDKYGFRPQRIISVDRERMTYTLIAGGIGVGLLHGETLNANFPDKAVEIVCKVKSTVREYFAHLQCRENDPLLGIVTSMVCAAPGFTKSDAVTCLQAS